MVTLAWKCAAIPATRPAAALQRSEKSTGNKMCFISNMGRLGSNAIFRLLHLDGDALIQKSCLAVARSQHNRVKARFQHSRQLHSNRRYALIEYAGQNRIASIRE